MSAAQRPKRVQTALQAIHVCDADEQLALKQILKDQGILERKPRGERNPALNDRLLELSDSGLSAGQIARLPEVDSNRPAILKQLQRLKKKRGHSPNVHFPPPSTSGKIKI
jgi:hypothetical protein